MNNETILVVEDDAQTQIFICYALRGEGFTCITADTAQSAFGKLSSEHIDVMLLDLGLPDQDGAEVIKSVREWSELPIIVVSARDQEKEKAAVLDSGADDYLAKPFSAIELMARIRVSLRHLRKQRGHGMYARLTVGGLSMDPDKHLIQLDGTDIHLSPMEYSLLSLLMKNMGKVLTTAVIIKEIWGAGYGTDTQALRALMAGLRRKIEANPAKPRYIMTEIGVGYRLVDE